MAADRPVIARPGRRALLAAAVLLVLVAAKPRPPEPRRIALRVDAGVSVAPDFERIAAWAKRRGIEVETGPEGAAVPKGFETAHLSTLPAPEGLAAQLARFPVALEDHGFLFDARTYTGEDAAIVLADPARPREVFVLGNTSAAVVALAAQRLFRREGNPPDYEVVSGELTKEGRFVARDGRLAIDRASDRDRIAAREQFFQDLKREKRGAQVWEVRDADRAAAAPWEKLSGRFAGKRAFTVRVYPDAVTKALYTGSSRPADLVAEQGRIRVELDASAPASPDLVSPVFAAAALAAASPALAERPTLLLAAGARRVGTWWGREVRGFAAFARAAGAEPSVEEVVKSSEEVSPVLAIGAAAAWLDAGARLDGDAAAEKALLEKAPGLAAKLDRWREAALRQSVKPPPRRPLPEGFLCGVSYAMTNAIDGSYVSPRSLETLKRLRGLSADSISVMPFAFARDAKAERISFVHASPRGETDEGTLRAVSDARSLGMTAMVKPQIWLGGSAFVGDIAMPDDDGWRRWFAAYRRFIVHHAVVAEAAGAALFCAGTELAGTEAREKEWRDTFAAVRLATGAPLLYAANWAANAPKIMFWDALDAIGVDFYDPLGKTEKLSDAALEEGARRAARPVAELARRAGKPVVFTEAGYPPVRGAWIAPHDEDSGRPPSGEDAARAIAAVGRALGRESWWKGVYWWKVFSDGGPARPGERGFNLLGTPAEKAIADVFAKAP